MAKSRRGPLIAALLAFLVGLPCAMMLPPLDRDESRFVQASAQMMETHDYININVQKVPRYKKPVGIHWLQVAAVKLTSQVQTRNIFPYRLPSLLGAALAAAACAWGASRAFGTRVGLKAGLLFAVTFMLSTEAFWAKTDAVLCGLVTLMMVTLSQIYLRNRDIEKADAPRMFRVKLVFWLAVAGTIMIKGPIGPMILAVSLLMLGLWDRKCRWMARLGWGWGLILTLLICGPWAIAITVTTDGAFWRGAVGHDLATKLNGGSEGHFMWPGYHLVFLACTFFPASWLLGGALQTAIVRRHEAAIRFAIAWFLPAFLIFELSPTKLPHYPLPTFGALAWLSAVSLDLVLKRWAWVLNWVIGIGGGLAFSAIAIVGFHLYGASPGQIVVAIVVISALGLGGFAGWLLTRDHQRTGFGFLLAAGVLTHLGFVTELTTLKPLWVSRKLEQALVDARLDPRRGLVAGPVAILGYAEPSFVFRMGTGTQLLNDDAAAAAQTLKNGQPTFVDSRYEATFQAEAKKIGITPHQVSVVTGHNYNASDVKITLYDNPPPVDPDATGDQP